MTGNSEQMIDAIRRSMCADTGYTELGINRTLLHTGHFFPDGDEFRIVLEYREEDGWIITDDGHTAMWLSYEDFEITDARKDVLRRVLNTNGAKFDEGEVYVKCDENNAGKALKSLIQTIQQMSDLIFLRKETVRSTFNEELKEVLYKSFGTRCKLNMVQRIRDEDFTFDAYIEASSADRSPIYILSVHAKDRGTEASIALLNIETERLIEGKGEYHRKPGAPYYMTVISDDAGIPKKTMDRIINKSDIVHMGIADVVKKANAYA
ncbi:MAG: DUF1828 domain-containing protein [Gammaproteobacteria bacterium]|nr:DUF1828 domain-containing protein [Gammaproteobacteria bacterium]